MAAATMALSSSFAAAAAVGAPWRGVVGAGRAAVGFSPRRRAVTLDIRAQAEPEVEPTKEETTTSTPSPVAAVPKAKPAASTGLWDVLAFSGPATERINGRLAMVGFVSVLAVEASRGGELLEEASSGVMSADAELWNGRFAMLGLVALAFTEFLTGSPLVNV
uniref:Uncharacterized protein n=1 Tax=Oryza barthii TaxID=65489 RepID=A0A0D3ELQ2_9ORYZ